MHGLAFANQLPSESLLSPQRGKWVSPPPDPGAQFWQRFNIWHKSDQPGSHTTRPTISHRVYVHTYAILQPINRPISWLLYIAMLL
jgi:hypothetical protein